MIALSIHKQRAFQASSPDAATNVFTASATGTSSLLNWDDNGTATGGNFEAIVLVGFAGTGSTTADGLITLA